MTTCMTFTLCATTTGTCTEATTQVIPRSVPLLHDACRQRAGDVLISHVNPFAPSAYCKNSIDGQWYCFDDSEVSPVADDDVCQQTAYILFYQRRTVIPSWSANSSVAGRYSWQLLKCSFIAIYLREHGHSTNVTDGLHLNTVAVKPETNVLVRFRRFHQLFPV